MAANSKLLQIRRSLGYCPQFDALNPLLTGREHLRLYARLRGLDEESVQKVTDRFLRTLGASISDVRTERGFKRYSNVNDK